MGEAITDVPVVVDKPVDGDQEYVLAPLTVIVVFCPLQMLALLLVVSDGDEFTVTATVRLAVQPAVEVPMIV
jgi:hypothetical protein